MRLLKRYVLFAGLLLLAWLGVIASGWLPRALPGDLEALAALRAEQPQVSGERNAYAALYVFGHEVPEDQWEVVATADVAAFERHVASRQVGDEFKPLAGTDYPPIPGPAGEHPALCGAWLPSCLPRVRDNQDAARELVAQGAAQLDRFDQLAGYDHYRYLMKPRFDSPITVGAGRYLGLSLTAAALDHVGGNSEAAFARLCRAGATWRRLRARSDNLLVDMIGVAYLSGASRLYAEMLAELPLDTAPPCVETFSPLRDEELDQCASFAFEFHAAETSLNEIRINDLISILGADVGWVDKAASMLVNLDHAIRMNARFIGRYCLAPHRQRALARSPEPLPMPETCAVSAWIFDPVGCRILGAALPNYEAYYLRLLDLDGRLRVLANARWLRGQALAGDPVEPGGEDTQGVAPELAQVWASRFAQRPATLFSTPHDISFDPIAGTLRMHNLDRGRGEYWEVPVMLHNPPRAQDPSVD